MAKRGAENVHLSNDLTENNGIVTGLWVRESTAKI